jgi:hypothetical protein
MAVGGLCVSLARPNARTQVAVVVSEKLHSGEMRLQRQKTAHEASRCLQFLHVAHIYGIAAGTTVRCERSIMQRWHHIIGKLYRKVQKAIQLRAQQKEVVRRRRVAYDFF